MTTLSTPGPVLYCATGHVQVNLRRIEGVKDALGSPYECPLCKLKAVVSPKPFQLLFCLKHGQPVQMRPEGKIGTNADTYRCPVCDEGYTVYPFGDFEHSAPRPNK